MKPSTKNDQIHQGTFGPVQLVNDFLPPPEELILKTKPQSTKITLTLDRNSLDFFKSKAQELGGSYQRMIRNLINDYVSKYQN